jgi:hypothetical protein
MAVVAAVKAGVVKAWKNPLSLASIVISIMETIIG